MGRKKIEEDYFVFLDLSNFIFHRFHALNTWKSFSNNTFETDEEILYMYEKMFEKHFLTIKKKLNCKWNNIFLAKDCHRADIWRIKHYPEYKACRSTKTDIIGEIFKKTYTEIIPRLQKEHNFNLLYEAEAEADDIISVSKKYLREKYPNRFIIILTNDNDYIQLIDDYTIIKNQNYKQIVDRIPKMLSCFDHKKMGEKYLFYKILKGDTSDNINPVTKQITQKNILDYIENPEKLEKLLSENHELREKYDMNNLLINMNMIPEELQCKIRVSLLSKI